MTLLPNEIREIVRLHFDEGVSQVELSRRYKVSHAAIFHHLSKERLRRRFGSLRQPATQQKAQQPAP